MKKFAVIMAGGGGARFWPLSRMDTPKQLLNLTGKDSLLEQTLARVCQVLPPENVFILTDCALAEKIRQTLQDKIPAQNVLSEPVARGTAACIGYAACVIAQRYGDGVMLVTPADAYISNEKAFAQALRTAAAAAEESNKVVTIGITPTFPATGYGYIQQGKGQEDCPVKPVVRFVEKPDAMRAREYLFSGEYLWNSGIFVWKASVALDKIKRFLPKTYQALQRLSQHLGSEQETTVLEQIYPTLPDISIDYGVMEKCEDILVLPAEFGWSDVGSWDMLGAVYPADGHNNVAVGDVLLEECQSSTVYAASRTVALLGVENLIVVETPDAVMVCPKDRAQDVKQITQKLQQMGKRELL